MRHPALLSFLLLPGCMSFDSLARPPADKRRFVLEAARPERAPAAADRHLAVTAFQANPAYAGPGFVHRGPDGAVEADFHSEFFVPPAVLVADAARRWLAASGLYATVAYEGSRVLPSHVLEGEVTDLYVDSAAGEAVLGVEFLLLDADRRGLLRHVRLAHRAPLADRRPETIVQGWSACLAAVLAALEAELRAGG